MSRRLPIPIADDVADAANGGFNGPHRSIADARWMAALGRPQQRLL